MSTQAVKATLLAKLDAALTRWYKGDPYGYAELFAADISYFDPFTNERLTSGEELRRHYALLEGKAHFPRFEIVSPHLHSDNGSAILTYFLKQFTADGQSPPTWKTTEVYRDAGAGDWKIVHAHWSTCSEDA